MSDLATAAQQRACPSCAEPMARRGFERKPQGALDLDICFACQAIWFDQYESSQLTPGAIIELFRVIEEAHGATPRPLSQRSRCPVCRLTLELTHDIQRTNRITYYRCPAAHGRLTTFFTFLREKDFVRTLSPAETERLRATVAQVRCSGCGAPIDVGRDPQCRYCGAPIAILDADAVAKALAQFGGDERRRAHVNPTASIDAMLATQRFERQLERIERRAPTVETGSVVLDLVGEALGFFLKGI